jgi:hypothetical protein
MMEIRGGWNVMVVVALVGRHKQGQSRQERRRCGCVEKHCVGKRSIPGLEGMPCLFAASASGTNALRSTTDSFWWFVLCAKTRIDNKDL